ncbi:hypothetical protein CRG98_033987 [Punica granatum]|uniref:Uncharacterized protein n=1 Tax=Punica granatum TaxID=22663 RepID=A0A2I0INU9_PUNGR|nr:hypothetical protein CRG98_033987 [Punica granatum]
MSRKNPFKIPRKQSSRLPTSYPFKIPRRSRVFLSLVSSAHKSFFNAFHFLVPHYSIDGRQASIPSRPSDWRGESTGGIPTCRPRRTDLLPTGAESTARTSRGPTVHFC